MADFRQVTRTPALRNTPPHPTGAATTGMRWWPAKPTQYANVRFPKGDLGQRAKASYEAWQGSLPLHKNGA